MTYVAADDYTRATTTAGWGTSTNTLGVTNHAWAADGTGITGVNINSSDQGVNTTNASHWPILDDGTTRTTYEVVGEFTMVGSATTGALFGVTGNYHGTTGAGTDYYMCRYNGTQFELFKRDGSANTANLGTLGKAFTACPGVGAAAAINTKYRVKLNVTQNGSGQPVLNARIWLASGTEPSTWDLTYTDTAAGATIKTAGRNGVYIFGASTSNYAAASFYTLDDLASPPVAGSATVTGTGALAATGQPTVIGADTLSGSGTLSGGDVGQTQVPGAPAVGATGALGATGQTQAPGASAVGATGQVSVTGQVQIPGASAVGSTGSVSASGSVPGAGGTLLGGIGFLSSGGGTVVPGTAGVAGTGGVATTGQPTTPGQSSVTGVGSVAATGQPTVVGQDALSGTGAVAATGRPTVSGAPALSGSGALSGGNLGQVQVPGSATIGGAGAISATNLVKTSGTTPTGTGTGRAVLSAGTRAVSWVYPVTGSDTEQTVTSANSAGDGWAIGFNPSYGGALISALYERAAGSDVNPTLQNGNQTGASPAGTNPTNPGSQVSMHTGSVNYADGHFHVGEQKSGGTYHSSEEPVGWTVAAADAATTAGVRGKYSTVVTDANNLQYTITECLLPGEPGKLHRHVTIKNVGASTYTFQTGSIAGDTNGLYLTGPGGMLSTTGTGAQQGVWSLDSTHSYYGTVSTLAATALSTTPTAGEPDYIALLPNSGIGSLSTQRLAVMTAKFTKFSDVCTPTQTYVGASQNVDRVKPYWATSPSTLAVGASWDFYFCEFLSAEAMTTAGQLALAADYLQPGAPVASVGTLQTFSYPNHASFPFDLAEGSYVVTAGSGALTNQAQIALDLGPTVQANVRYKPCLRVEGCSGLTQTNGADLQVRWGGTLLTSGTDYNIAVDTTTQKAYIHLQFDVVASGATPTTGQKQNAVLAVAPVPVAGTAAVTGTGGIATTGQPTVPGQDALSGTATLISGGQVQQQGQAAPSGSGAISAAGVVPGTVSTLMGGLGFLSASGSAQVSGSAAITGTGAVAATGQPTTPGAAQPTGTGGISAAGQVPGQGTAAITGTGGLAETGQVQQHGAAQPTGTGSIAAGGQPTTPGTAQPSGAGGLSTTGQPTTPGSAGVSGTGGVSATGQVPGQGSAAIVGSGGIAEVGQVQQQGQPSISGTGGIVAGGRPQITGLAGVIGAGGLSASGQVLTPPAVIAGSGSLSTGGVVQVPGAGTVGGTGGVSAAGTGSVLEDVLPVLVSRAPQLVMTWHGGTQMIVMQGTFPPDDPFVVADLNNGNQAINFTAAGITGAVATLFNEATGQAVWAGRDSTLDRTTPGQVYVPWQAGDFTATGTFALWLTLQYGASRTRSTIRPYLVTVESLH